MLNARIRICSLTDAPLVAHAFRLLIWKKAIQKLAKKTWGNICHMHLVATGSQWTELFKWLQFQPFFYVQYELSERRLTVIQDYKQIKGFNFSRITVFSWGLTSGQSQHALEKTPRISLSGKLHVVPVQDRWYNYGQIIQVSTVAVL